MAEAPSLADAFTLTGFFLDRHAFAPRGLAMPSERARFLTAVMRQLASSSEQATPSEAG
jgi:DNA repair protein RecO (recombination protein O)